MGPPSPAEAHGVAPPLFSARRHSAVHPRVAGVLLGGTRSPSSPRWSSRTPPSASPVARGGPPPPPPAAAPDPALARLYVRFGRFLHQRGQATIGAAALLPAAQVPSSTTSAHHSRYSFPPLSPSFSAKLSTRPRTLSGSDLITSLSVCMWLRGGGCFFTNYWVRSCLLHSRMATLGNLKIKTSMCKRIVKELRSYEKEAAKTADMKEKGADPYDLKQQENVLAESRMMVSDWHKQLETALADLKATLAELKEPNEQGAEIGEAESTITEASEVKAAKEEEKVVLVGNKEASGSGEKAAATGNMPCIDRLREELSCAL
ncbi:uncharacterized protein [Miscanthus floridulus]|uniref:uncharacterized protein isoform X2 n=1 Tax=Miscanthus floridulus TaxID=154761 RepID=UPI003457ADF3